MKKHLLRISDLTKDEILAVLDRAEELRHGSRPKQFPGTLLGLLFFQPSTRTRFGFHAAIARLGGTGILLAETKNQPGMTRAETPEDTFRSIASYCDLYLLRHPRADFHANATEFSDAPILNAGNGCDEHPTQALIDLFTIKRLHGSLEGFRIAILGNLTASRAAHSLIRALRLFPPGRLVLISPPEARLPDQYRPNLLSYTESVDPRFPLDDLDILYVAGLPPEAEALTLDGSVRSSFSIHPAHLRGLPTNCKVLCPLPRIDEIHPTFDLQENAAYFLQSNLAQAVRLSVLEHYL